MAFEIVPTRLRGPLLIQPTVHRDERGFFVETFRADLLADLGIADDFVQDNHSRSTRGVVRGIHFTVGHGTSKLVRCVRGSIVDVVVDLRSGSPTFGEWESFELDDGDLRMAYVPVGFGHAFCVKSAEADVVYGCSGVYEAPLERAVAWDDPEIGVRWPAAMDLVVSDRDAVAPRLAEIRDELPFRYEE